MSDQPVRILVVDDELIMREMLRMMFERSDEFELVDACSTADAGLALAHEHDVDVVLLDLGLPDRAGHPLIADLCALESPPRVLVVSGRDDATSVDEAIGAGASGYVVKGDPQRILKGLRRIMRGETIIDLGRAAL